MKAISIISLSLLLFIQTQAQDFFQVGDQWTYSAFQLAPPWMQSPSTFRVAVDRDTIVQGKNAVIVKLGDIFNSQIIVRSDSQKLWIWRDNDFRLFADYTLGTGDTMEYYVPYAQFHYDISCGLSPSQNDRFRAVIDSVSFLDMNGFSLKQMHMSSVLDTSLASQWELGTITEGLGSDQGLWGRSLTQCLSGFWGEFACYFDIQRGVYVQDSLLCYGDTTTLPYPAFMLSSGFQWHEIDRVINEPNRSDIFYSVGDPLELDGEIWNPVCELYTSPFDTVAREFFVRHDSLARQLYYRHSIDSSARLLYDYNLSIGSVLDPNLYGVHVEPNTWVSAIDTLYHNGRPVRYFQFNGDPFGAGLYEGFGSDKGLFFGIGGCFCIASYITVQIDGQGIFDFPSLPLPQNCESFLVSNESDLSDLFSIIQSQEQIEIRAASQNAQPTQIQLFNLQGQSVYRDTQLKQAVSNISTQAFPEGVYLLKISQGQQVLNRKILLP